MASLSRASSAVCRAAIACTVLVGGVPPIATVLVPRAAYAQDDAYRQHMDNGVKLFQDQNYEGAIVEFEAAYKERPRASPLINVALCQKKQFKYPKAIATLELALANHGDTMDTSDRQAATTAIDEMKKLLAYVKIGVTPPGATLTVDGERQHADAVANPLPLAPGQHKITATMPGYATAERDVAVASGERPVEVTLTLTRVGAPPAAPIVGPIGPKTQGGEPKRRMGMMVTGLVMTGLGVISAAVGIVFIAADRCLLTNGCGTRLGISTTTDVDLSAQRTAGAVVTVVGGVLAAVGVPLAIIGAQKVAPAKPTATTWSRPELEVGAGSARLGWRF